MVLCTMFLLFIGYDMDLVLQRAFTDHLDLSHDQDIAILLIH